VTGLRAVAALRFREALAGGMLWLLPLHFAIAFFVVRTLPGPTLEARLQAADATALGLAAVLGLVAAAVMGASPLAAERLRSRGTLVLAAPVSPIARVLGTALGTGAALLLLVLGLCASAMAAVDFGVGGATRPPHEVTRASGITSMRPDAREPGLFWDGQKLNFIIVRFPRTVRAGDTLVVSARVRGENGEIPGSKDGAFEFGTFSPSLGSLLEMQAHPAEWKSYEKFKHVSAHAPLTGPFRIKVPRDCDCVMFGAKSPFEQSLGCRSEDVRVEGGPHPRGFARGFHAAALLGGLLAVMGAGMALSTVTGGGVGAGGALALALLALFQPLFADAADTLAYAGAMEKAMEAAQQGHGHAEALTGTPPALAPVFRALAAVLPDATRFDLAAAISANEVPYSGDVGRAVGLGLALCALFLLAAVLGARRRP